MGSSHNENVFEICQVTTHTMTNTWYVIFARGRAGAKAGSRERVLSGMATKLCRG